jgi:hypothetical protein
MEWFSNLMLSEGVFKNKGESRGFLTEIESRGSKTD